MKIKHLLENEIDVKYISDIRISPCRGFNIAAIHAALYESSLDADFEYVEASSTAAAHFSSASPNLRVIMKRTAYMINAIRSIKEIEQNKVFFQLYRKQAADLKRLTSNHNDVERFLQLNYSTEEQLDSIAWGRT